MTTNIDDSQLNKQIILIRDINTAECGSLGRDYKKGKRLYLYSGPTYGIIGKGVVCTEVRGKTPFFEIPIDAFKLVEEIAKA